MTQKAKIESKLNNWVNWVNIELKLTQNWETQLTIELSLVKLSQIRAIKAKIESQLSQNGVKIESQLTIEPHWVKSHLKLNHSPVTIESE